MKKKHKWLIAGAALCVLLTAAALAILLSQRFSGAAFTGTIPEGVGEQQAELCKISTMDYQLARKVQNAKNDETVRETLLTQYKKAQIFRKDTVTILECLTDNRQRVVLVVSGRGKQLQKYVLEEKLLLWNDRNSEMHRVEAAFQRNVTAGELPLLDVFQNNSACLEVFEKKETEKRKFTISALADEGYPAEQTMRVYETQSSFQTTAARGNLLPAGTGIAVVALAQKISMEALLRCAEEGGVSLDDVGALAEDTLFVTFKRQTFLHERSVTVTNPRPGYDGAEVYVFGKSGKGMVEVNYQTPQFINTEKDVVASNIMSKPGSMELCDEAYFNDALRVVNSMLSSGEDLVRWSEYQAGDTE